MRVGRLQSPLSNIGDAMSFTAEQYGYAIAFGRGLGLSASEIGKRIGMSRNAVLGRAFRFGLCDGDNIVQPLVAGKIGGSGRPPVFSASQLDFIRVYYKAGYSAGYLARLLRRNPKSVENQIASRGWSRRPRLPSR
jgi:hypothetical protein